jgi:hypothetical protein
LIEGYDCGLASFACEKNAPESTETLVPGFKAPGSNVLSVIVFAFDGADGGGGCEHCFDIVFVDNFPKDSGVGGADGFTFVEDRSGAVDEGCVDDVCVSDDLTSERELIVVVPSRCRLRRIWFRLV